MSFCFTDEDFRHLLNDNGELFLKYLFDKYYGDLCKLSFRYVGRTDIAEDLVQDVFINIWNKRHSLQYSGNIRPCLTTSVINTSINYIRSKFAKQVMVDESEIVTKTDKYNHHDNLVCQELNHIIKLAIENLPDKCRTIFIHSRFSGKSYKEIAELLEISTKTVENQISIALKKVEQHLIRTGYYLIIILLFSHFM